MSGPNNWETPKHVYDAICSHYGVWPVLDLAASENNRKCMHWFTQERSGLGKPIPVSDAVCWLNPPYTDESGRSCGLVWMRWCVDLVDHGATIACLLKNDPSTEWFETMLTRAKVVSFITERIQFVPPKGVKASKNNSTHVAALLRRGNFTQIVEFLDLQSTSAMKGSP